MGLTLPYRSGDFKRRLPRTPSTGTMSSADDLDDREPLSPLDTGESDRNHCRRGTKELLLKCFYNSAGLSDLVMEPASSPGPFRNTQMSKAAQTHKLRKLRAPSKCRECDSLVVFHGAECEEVNSRVPFKAKLNRRGNLRASVCLLKNLSHHPSLQLSALLTLDQVSASFY